MDRKSLLGFGVGLAVSVGLLGYLLSQLDWSLFLAELHRIHLGPLPLAAALFLLACYLRALRWRWLLPTGIELPTMRLFSATAIGSLASFVLPLRAGEFIRPWVLARTKKVTFSCALSSIVTERVFDVLAMLCMFAISLLHVANPPLWATLFARSLGALATVILCGMIVAYFQGSFVLRTIGRLTQLLPRSLAHFQQHILAIAEEGIAGLRAISSGKELLFIVLSSLGIWVLYSLVAMTVLWCFDLPEPLASQAHGINLFWIANTTNVFIALAVAAPSAPGFLGTFQLGCVASLAHVYGASEEFATAYSVLNHSLQFLLTVVIGFIMLQTEGLRFRQLASRDTQTPAAEAA